MRRAKVTRSAVHSGYALALARKGRQRPSHGLHGPVGRLPRGCSVAAAAGNAAAAHGLHLGLRHDRARRCAKARRAPQPRRLVAPRSVHSARCLLAPRQRVHSRARCPVAAIAAVRPPARHAVPVRSRARCGGGDYIAPDVGDHAGREGGRGQQRREAPQVGDRRHRAAPHSLRLGGRAFIRLFIGKGRAG